MKRNVIIAIMIAALVGGSYGGYRYLHRHEGHDHDTQAAAAKPAKQLYTCPMHPQIVSEDPGDCPICGMKLVPMNKTDGASSGTAAQSGVQTPPGLAPLSVPEAKRMQMGLSLTEARLQDVSRDITTSLRIVPDETRQSKVTTKVGGWVETLRINQTGQYVQKGQPLLDIYSQELLAAQDEHLSAIKARDLYRKGADQSLLKTFEDVVASSRSRLELLDMTSRQIETLEKTGKAQRTVTLHAATSGYVADKPVLPGQRIMPGESIMTITDLSHVWGEADIYQADMPYVTVGMPVVVTLPFWPGKSFSGRVSFLNPFLNPETRTMKARIELANPGTLLKPEMFANATLSYGVGRKVVVPEQAVMRSGAHDYVFVAGKGDELAPREVTVGILTSDGNYEIVSGLKKGERVVSAANFLVDSESSLKAAFQAVTQQPSPGTAAKPAAPPAGAHAGHGK